MARQRLIIVSLDLLAAIFHLPEGSKIVGVSQEARFHMGEIVFKIEHESFSDVPEMTQIPQLVGEFEIDDKTNRIVAKWKDA